jgi:hypothetical protein
MVLISGIQRYKAIADPLIIQSFPELRNEKIKVIEKVNVKYRAHASYLPWGMVIIVSDKLNEFPSNKTKRILIHELCHLSIFKSWGVMRTNLDFLLYSLSSKHRDNVEKDANLLMIKKGYGNLVLEARKENLKRGIRCSLSEQEIKSYMKKWQQYSE